MLQNFKKYLKLFFDLIIYNTRNNIDFDNNKIKLMYTKTTYNYF